MKKTLFSVGHPVDWHLCSCYTVLTLSYSLHESAHTVYLYILILWQHNALFRLETIGIDLHHFAHLLNIWYYHLEFLKTQSVTHMHGIIKL